MIKVSGLKNTTTTENRVVRATVSSWTTNGKAAGDVQTNEINVLYYSPTIRELREAKTQMEQYFKDNPGEPFYLSDVLVKRLHSLPDLKVGVDQPNELTSEWLESQDLMNLDAVNQAIKDDLNPPK